MNTHTPHTTDLSRRRHTAALLTALALVAIGACATERDDVKPDNTLVAAAGSAGTAAGASGAPSGAAGAAGEAGASGQGGGGAPAVD
ncbi:MAG: hypothetical protein IT374_09250, partial [Polyangiaceae bacterium]|nr:hypothetical protein [Polyangiaceae bacterium]